MDENTKAKLAAFAEKFRAQRHDAETRKIEGKKAAADLAARKDINRKFHIINKPLPGGVRVSDYENDERVEMLRRADDANWRPLAVLVTGQWQVCRCCGHEAVATSGFYFREQHKTIPSAKRLRAVNHIPEGFEIEVNVEGVVLQRCVKCLDGHLVDDIFSSLLHGGELRISNQLSLFKD